MSKDKIIIHVPLHITAIQDIYMANMQSRFFKECKKYFNVFCIMTIDKDITNKFDDLFVNTSTDKIIDIRKEKPVYGIRNPTTKALECAFSMNCNIFIRITQDTQIFDIEKFVTLINSLSKSNKFICGRKDTCSDIKKYLKEIGIEQNDKRYSFVQGNLVIASIELWEQEYKRIPKSVQHYCEDSIFSYLCQYSSKVNPTFINNDFWRENRTRDIYYLESLYQ
jgi:hypothetical protein